MTRKVRAVAMVALLITLGTQLAGFAANQRRSGSSRPRNLSQRKPHDPVIQQPVAIYTGSTALTPSVAMTESGRLLVSWVSRGDARPGAVTGIAMSTEDRERWYGPHRIERSSNPLVGTSGILQTLPMTDDHPHEIALWTVYAEHISLSSQTNRKFRTTIRFSEDGVEFDEPIPLNDPAYPNAFPQGSFTILPNGDLLWPWADTGENPISGFRRSSDRGRTWSPLVRAWPDPPPDVSQTLRFNETGVASNTDGVVLAVARNDVLIDKRLWQIRSDDMGESWSEPVAIEPAGGSPAMFCTPAGQFWLAYRDAGVGPGIALAVSDDAGDTWRFLDHLKEPTGEHERLYGNLRFTDAHRKERWRPAEGVVGYPQFQALSDREVYVVFHAQNRSDLLKRFPDDAPPYFIAGNLLVIPQ